MALTAGADRVQERIGLRTIAVRGRRLLLNGRPLRLRGVNRHEFHPDSGPAVPPAVMLKDLAILRRMGATFVRGAHYPNDPLFLDLCDEAGLLFWDEVAHWAPGRAQLADPAFRAASLAQARAMVRQHRHHPSILCWGFLNEAHTDLPEARPVVRELAAACRRLDPTRPVTYASNRPWTDRCLDLVDIVSFNVYPGWYGGHREAVTAVALRPLLAVMRRRSRGKPVIISEFGAGAMDGVRSFEPRKWTEGYQAELLDALIAAWESAGFICGWAVWQFHDVRTSPELGLKRIREYNNKGVLTEWREPKLAWHHVASWMRRGRALGR